MPSPSPLLILIADDDECRQSFSAETLRQAEYAIIEARTGDEALRIGRTGPSLIILGSQLPDLASALRRLKTDPATAAIPVLQMIAVHPKGEAKALIIEDGADAYLTDASEPDVLLAAVSALLRMRRAEESAQAGTRAWLSTLGHELRNPLAPIRNALYLMKLRRSKDPGDVDRLCRIMERQITHLARLVDDLLDVSRISEGTFELRTEGVDLWQAIANAIEEVRPFLDERGHTLEVSLPMVSVRLEADPARLEQIFANLLHNAAKYTESDGRITISAALEKNELGMTNNNSRDKSVRSVPRCAFFVEVRVRDTGIGIRPEVVGRIFDMFTQGDRLSGGLKEGLGLGLTLVKTLVEMHGGTVEATSAGSGSGSEFVVRLPLPAGMEPNRGLRREPTGNGRPKRILAADDNAKSGSGK